MHKDLVAFHAHMSDPKNWPLYGLCTALENFRVDYYTQGKIHDLMRAWPKHSGDENFPLPGGQDAYEYFLLVEDRASYMWDRTNSPYAALRWELLEWMIEETKE